MFVPGAKQIMTEFGFTNQTLSTMTVAVYILGLALGTVIFAPLSEIYGRLPVYAATSDIFVAFMTGCAFAMNLAEFILFRFLSGCAAAASQALSGGTLADVIPREKRGRWMGMIILGPMLGPTIGPIAGGFIAQDLDWRWSFRILAIASGIVAVPAVFFLRETSPKIILARKHQRQSNICISNETSFLPTSAVGTSFSQGVLRPVRILFLSTVVLCLSLAVAFNFGLMFFLFASFPTVFQG
ncbi:fluconazole resistance protein 1 [Colletotrichum truncatum]|uniref:Fluconazole resistance protein 1 n=1 Tax=Colletotrichum truncatum TaxID=5467 RepID=A0ACC3YU57_COLTU|nr:fluconazole resistance protein 1 [Colletotrichum truncatum]KAF6798686.1 fluconazole resistance protein 1 [Colletotrichum truncatum]